MSLTLVATPIGHPEDITLRALKTIRDADVLIGEERKPLFALLKQLEIPRPEHIEYLNEHSTKEDVQELLQLCESQDVVLISDCGTPGFCDPGADLVKAARLKRIKVTSCPGASSLMTLLSLAGQRLDQFYFRGFLPANKEKRLAALKDLKKTQDPFIIMDTPYRLQKTISDLKTFFPQKNCVLGLSLTQENEMILQHKIKDLPTNSIPKKAEFLIIVY